MDDSYKSILPPEVAAGIERIGADRVQEIRLRCGQRASCLMDGRERTIPWGTAGYPVDGACLQAVVNKATGYSAYAASDQLRCGFLTLPGGHRLGLCGRAVMGAEGVKTLKEISSVNLRIAREVGGGYAEAKAYFLAHPVSTLIAGPPGCGKTTLLRTLIRACSDARGERVGIADERMEIAAVSGGRAGFPVGRLTDVLSGLPKHEGLYMLLRTMNPDWVAVDEITEERDLDALLRASFCGVRLLATAHLFSAEDLHARPLYARLCEMGLFERLILMDKQHETKAERMIANDKALGCGDDRHCCKLCGNPHGESRSDGGTCADAGEPCA